MAQFASNIVQVNSSVGTIMSLIWNPGNTSTTTFGALGSVSSTAVLSGLIVANTGTNTIYINSGSANTSVSGTVGTAIAPNSEVYFSGYSGTGAAAGSIWAQTQVVGQTSSTMVGLPSVPSVI